jgi:urease gamma subunit
MDDQYFINKAIEMEDLIAAKRIEKGWKITHQEIIDLLYLKLKEISKDQRYYSISKINELEDSKLKKNVISQAILNS